MGVGAELGRRVLVSPCPDDLFISSPTTKVRVNLGSVPGCTLLGQSFGDVGFETDEQEKERIEGKVLSKFNCYQSPCIGFVEPSIGFEAHPQVQSDVTIRYT